MGMWRSGSATASHAFWFCCSASAAIERLIVEEGYLGVDGMWCYYCLEPVRTLVDLDVDGDRGWNPYSKLFAPSLGTIHF